MSAGGPMLDADQLDTDIEYRRLLLVERGQATPGMAGDGMKRLSFRSKVLIKRIVWLVAMRADGCPWVELLATADPDGHYAQATIDGTIRDLIVFGAVWISGHPAGRGFTDERIIHLTDLGAAMMKGDVDAMGVMG